MHQSVVIILVFSHRHPPKICPFKRNMSTRFVDVKIAERHTEKLIHNNVFEGCIEYGRSCHSDHLTYQSDWMDVWWIVARNGKVDSMEQYLVFFFPEIYRIILKFWEPEPPAEYLERWLKEPGPTTRGIGKEFERHGLSTRQQTVYTTAVVPYTRPSGKVDASRE